MKKKMMEATANDKQLGAEMAAESVAVGAGLVVAGFGAASFLFFHICSIDHHSLLQSNCT